MTGKAVVYFEIDQGTKNEHSRSDVRLFVTTEIAQKTHRISSRFRLDTSIAYGFYTGVVLHYDQPIANDKML